MTKQRAYVIARAELWSKAVTEKQIKDRSIEIYAGAFAEWVPEKGWVSWLNWDNSGEVLWCRRYHEDKKNYTTAELLIEFEKI